MCNKSRTRLFDLSKQTFPSHVSEVDYYLRFYRCQYRNSRALLPVIQYNYFLHKLSFKLKEKATLKNFAIFTGKHLCLLKTDSFIKKRLQHRCFPVNIAKCFVLRLSLGSHLRVPSQGPTLGSHFRVPPQRPTVGSHLRVPRQGLCLPFSGSHSV